MIIKKIKNYMKEPSYPGLYWRKDTFDGAESYLKYSYAINVLEMKKRKRILSKLFNINPLFFLPKEKGFVRADFSSHHVLRRAVDRCNEVIDRWLAEGSLENQKGVAKQFLRNIDIPKENSDNSPIYEFALSREVIKSVADYLGVLPILLQAKIWYSPNTDFLGRSQLYHIDHADFRQVKLFVCLDDVDMSSGPLNAVPANVSRKAFASLLSQHLISSRNTKVEDDLLIETAEGDYGVFMTGKKYEAAIVDTSQCYHYGSRPPCDGTGKPRKILFLQYTTPFPSNMPLFGRKRVSINFPFLSKPEDRDLVDMVLGYTHHMYLKGKLEEAA